MFQQVSEVLRICCDYLPRCSGSAVCPPLTRKLALIPSMITCWNSPSGANVTPGWSGLTFVSAFPRTAPRGFPVVDADVQIAHNVPIRAIRQAERDDPPERQPP
jgi:hypothetical protein